MYKFHCLRDANITYIGKTKRHLATRIKEHERSSSAIHDHISSCEACNSKISTKSFNIIDSGTDDFDITIREALHIKSTKPILNRQLFSQGASFILNIFQ